MVSCMLKSALWVTYSVLVFEESLIPAFYLCTSLYLYFVFVKRSEKVNAVCFLLHPSHYFEFKSCSSEQTGVFS